MAQRKFTALQHRATLVSSTLEETAAALERSDGGDLGYLRERLLSASRSLEADFASIEAKLAGLGLPEKVEAWREFVRHYRGRLAEVDAELASGSLSPTRRAALRAKLGGAAQPPHASVRGAAPVSEPRPLGSGFTALAPPQPAEAGSTQADDVPMPADLAESKTVLLTPEIRAKAAELGKDATALYNWVATNVEYLPAMGQMQNSQAVLLSGRGTDLDQATLLIALLRAAGIPARYVSADVSMPRKDVREWMGVKDETLILSLLSRFEDFLLFPSVQQDRAVATRAWVEAYIETGGEKRWMVMDPALKRRSFQPGILLTRPVYDRMAYLKALKPVPPSEPYLDALRAEFHKKYPGRGFNEVPYVGTLLPPPPPAREHQYPVVKLHYRASEVPALRQHRIRLTLAQYFGTVTYLNVDLVLPEVVLQPITLSFNPATSADRQVAQAFGGVENTPAALVNLLPEFRLGDQVIATGKTAIAMGTILDLKVNHLPPVQDVTPYVNTNRHMFTAGETAALVLGAHLVSEEVLSSRISSFLSRLPAASTAEATRRLLEIAALRYLHRVELDEQRVGDPLQVRFYPDDEVGNAITFASLEPQNLFDRPFVVTPGRLQIHAWPTCLPFVDLNRSDHNDPVIKSAWQLHNDGISVLEHEIWEELVMIPSVSTIKILQAAIRENVPIRVITRDSPAAELAALEVPQAVREALRGILGDGATVTIPQRPLTIGSWRGTGWIEEYPNWNFNYVIFDFALLSPGGDTGNTPPPPRPPQNEPGAVGNPQQTQNTTCSDPVNVANGNLFEQVTDYTLATQGSSIIFQRTYNSLNLADGPLGPGWRHSFQVSLKESAGSIVMQEGSGTTLTFRLVGGAFVSPPGYYLTLSKDAPGYLLRTKHGLETRFDARGALQSITDRNQNALQFAYEAERLQRITDRAGRAVTLSYDSRGRITALEDFTGRRVTYEYDAAGRLSAVTNAGGGRTAYAYYTDRIFNHLLKSFTTAEGAVTSFQYYANGKVARVTLPGGQNTSFVYLPMRNETHVIDARGLLTSYQYNSLGSVVKIARPDGSYLESVYNAQAKIESQTDAAGYTTRYSYDAAGNLTSVTDPLGRVLRFTYEGKFNLVSSVRDAAGNETEFEYDARGNLTRAVKPQGVETRFSWDSAGNLTARTDPEGNMVTFTYDEVGNVTSVRDALGNVSKREFDRLKRLTHAVDPLGGEVWLEYDALGRLVRQTDPLGRTAGRTYDRDGRLVKVADYAGRTATFRYDVLNHLTQVTDALGQVTEYAYATPDCGCSATANLTAFRDPAGRARSQTYDFLDRLVSSTDALGSSTQYGYDAQGSLASKRDASGNLVTFERDAAGRITRRLYTDRAETRFVYDASNNLVSASNQHVAYTFTYDALNRLRTFTDSRFNKTLTYGYDRLGRRTSLTDSEGGLFLYAWDTNSRLVWFQNPAGATAAFEYDALGRRTRLSYSNGAVADSQYDAAGRLTSLLHGVPDAPAPLATFAYAYDATGNTVAVSDAAGAHAYQYDALDRLVAATHPSLAAESYRYDAAGNRLETASEGNYTYDAAGRLLSAGGVTYAYDKNGNLTQKTTASGVTAYTWNGASQLVRIDLPDGAVVTYKYDPLGRRIEKNVNGAVTAYLYDFSSILLALDASGGMLARYAHGTGVDEPLMMERGGQAYFYHQDGQWNVVQLTDAAGNSVCSYSYDSFGRTQPCQSVVNPHGFAGREYDGESGLYFMRARYYDPVVGRFISPDPLDLASVLLGEQDQQAALALLPAASAALAGPAGLGSLRGPQQLSPYSYALNNPAALRDPSGLKCEIHFMIGMEPHDSGASALRDDYFGGTMTPEKFDHWLHVNHYGISYVEGSYAAIHDSHLNVVGVVRAEDVGITPVSYPQYTTGQALAIGLSEIGQILKEKFEASLKVDWNKLHGQQYWDAANNPENYV
ncbi:MAG: hypothetical protein FJW34_17415, partial [Acidobacteria bacterium]|nr:hypothetical protein [Acidobacteriota bacterium]